MKNNKVLEDDTGSQISQTDQQKDTNEKNKTEKTLPPSAGLSQGDCGESVMSIEEDDDDENHKKGN